MAYKNACYGVYKWMLTACKNLCLRRVKLHAIWRVKMHAYGV